MTATGGAERPPARLEAWAFRCLAASVFLAPFSLPGGRVALAASLALLVADRVARRQRLAVPAVAWAGLAWVVLACVVTVFGVNPALGCPKLRKLAWFAGIPVAAALVRDRARLTLCLQALAAGTGVQALRICIGNPLRARAAVAAGRFDDFVLALIHHGSMTNGQRLLLGIVVCLAFVLACRAGRARRWWWGLLALQFVAMLVNAKRGSWVSVVAVTALFVGLRAGWRRSLLLVVALVAACGLLPPVRTRLAMLRDEFAAQRGGRVTMWTQVAPVLIRQHPFGIGYRSLTNEMMRRIAPEIEPNRDHLHSNPVQVLVATGWAGLALYVLWMGVALRDGVSFARRAAAGCSREEACLALALLMMLAGLLANGLVEYNLGDSELVLPYGFILGAAAAGRMRTPPRRPAPPVAG